MNKKLTALTGAIALVGALGACSSPSSSPSPSSSTGAAAGAPGGLVPASAAPAVPTSAAPAMPTSAAPTPHLTSQPLTGTGMGTGTLNLTTGAESVTFTGDFSPLGAVTGHENLTVTFTSASTFSYTGTKTIVTANGDEVFSTVIGSGTYTSSASQGTETDTITGGTGRFTGAGGTYTEPFSCVVVSATATTETLNVTGTAHGTISY